MFRSTISVVLVVLMFATSALASAPARRDEEKAREKVEKVRREISRLGTGPDARVEVRLRDKTRRKGYVKEVAADSFVVRDAKTGQDYSVAFAEVDGVGGRNLSTGVKIAIWSGVAAGAVLLTMIAILYIGTGGQ